MGQDIEHVGLSNSRDELNVNEAEENILPMDFNETNADLQQQQEQEQQQQQNDDTNPEQQQPPEQQLQQQQPQQQLQLQPFENTIVNLEQQLLAAGSVARLTEIEINIVNNNTNNNIGDGNGNADGNGTGNSSEDDLANEPDETLAERFFGLAEMFPDPVRNCAHKISTLTKKSFRNFYKNVCNTSWILFSSAVILFAPIAFENERAQLQEFQKLHEKQMLMGPGTAISSAQSTPKLRGH